MDKYGFIGDLPCEKIMYVYSNGQLSPYIASSGGLRYTSQWRLRKVEFDVDRRQYP
jgi:hypothetical protein